jgi:hypothetical protein
MAHYTTQLNKLIKGLEKASKSHAAQVKVLEKILADQKKTYGPAHKKKKK